MNRNGLFVYFSVIFILLVQASTFLFGQSTSTQIKPTVFYFDCDYTSAASDSTVLDSTAKFLYQTIVQDTLTKQTLFIAREALDTAAESGAFSLPSDTVLHVGADYIIGSKITINSGNYDLTIYTEDGYDRTKIDSGTAVFSSATFSNLKTACKTAATKILPLITNIRTYQKKLRSNNPQLSIDPQIMIKPAKTQLKDGETINVTITASDYDGSPLSGRIINLTSNGGFFSSNSVTTGGNGQVVVPFTAVNYDIIADISASMSGEKLVTHDTTTVNNDVMLMVGTPQTNETWQLSFNYTVEKFGFEDKYSFDGPNEDWTQSSNTSTRNVSGIVTGWGILVLPTFIFNASSSPSIGAGVYENGFTTGKYLGHNLTVGTGHDYFHDCYSSSLTTTTDNGNIPSPFKLYSASMTVNNKDTTFSLTTNFNQNHSYQLMYRGWGGTDFCKADADSSFNKFDTGSLNLNAQAGEPNTFITYNGKAFLITLNSVTVQQSDNFAASNNRDSKIEVIDSSFNAILEPLQMLTDVKSAKQSKPLSFSLSQNYPNPFNPSTLIEYQIPNDAHVKIKVFDVMGNQVAVLLNGNVSAGSHVIRFNGSKLASGVYFYRIEAGGFSETKKFILIK